MEDLKKIQEFFSKSLNEISKEDAWKKFQKEKFVTDKTIQAARKDFEKEWEAGKLKEGTFDQGEIAIYMGNDDSGTTHIFKRGSGYYGYNDEFDFEAASKEELQQKLDKWGYELLAGSLEEAQFTDYSNKELAAYCKNNPTDKKAAKELHKRSQALKNLSRTDVNEGGVAGWKKASMSMIKHIQKQLDDMGVKYEMGDTPYAPFKTIYKPINKSDDWYDKFDDLIWRANLRGVVKTSMDEATKDEETTFHKKLDKLVHDTFGKRKGEMEEMKGVPVEKTPATITQKEWDKTPKSAKAIINGIAYIERYDRVIGTYMAPIKIVDEIEETELTEAYVPSNIAEFAKRRGISPLVRKVAGWAERVGARITGGTAIGYGYNTLILDLGYQTGDIRIDVEDETIELYDEPVYSFNDFKRVFMEEETRKQAEHDEETLRREQGLEEGASTEEKRIAMSAIKRIAKYRGVSEDEARNDLIRAAKEIGSLKEAVKDMFETIQLGKNLNEELCAKGKAYIKKRQAAGEKSSAYLSGRAVKVCKGQMKG